MAAKLVDFRKMGDALRNTGYKNIESAASEIVDNSAEAQAKNVFIILRESTNTRSGRKVVTEIAFLDDGCGMDEKTISECLVIGGTTRQERKGMGRFGVGLPQSSLYACPDVEVYSWQDGIENCKKVYLDIEKVKNGDQTEIEDPKTTVIPKEYNDYIKFRTENNSYDFTEHGTLVIWKRCDRVNPKTRGPLQEHLEFALGRKFRYFIHRNIMNIRIIADENREFSQNILPNDPMQLMPNNRLLGDPNNPGLVFKYDPNNPNLEPFFEPYTGGTDNLAGVVQKEVTYIDRNNDIKKGNVTIRFSKVKDKFYDETAFPSGNPGSTPMGDYVEKLEGISVIRANREIDFGKFDFYNPTNEPQHRWWGCEIEFDTDMDEAFGISNNKQYVDLKRIDEKDIDEEEEVQPMWWQLSEVIIGTIKQMYAENKELRKQTREVTKIIDNSTTAIINTIEEELDDADGQTEKPNIPIEDIIKEGKIELENHGIENPTDEQAIQFINNEVNISYKENGTYSPAFDFKFKFDTAIITINTSHKLYRGLLSKIEDNAEAKTSFELFVAAFVQAVKKTDKYQPDANDKLVSEFYKRVDKYIDELLNPRKVGN